MTSRADNVSGDRVELYGNVAPGDDARWNAWSVRKDGEWLVPKWLSGSDYSGGYVTRANYEVFTDEWWNHDPAFLVNLSGGHNTYGLALLIDKVPDDAWEQLEGLENYPVLDEYHMAELEMEGTDEAWKSWGLREWKQLIEKEFDCDCDKVTDGEWREHFENARESVNMQWEAQGDEPSMYVDMEKVYKRLDEVEMPERCECGETESTEADRTELQNALHDAGREWFEEVRGLREGERVVVPEWLRALASDGGFESSVDRFAKERTDQLEAYVRDHLFYEIGHADEDVLLGAYEMLGIGKRAGASRDEPSETRARMREWGLPEEPLPYYGGLEPRPPRMLSPKRLAEFQRQGVPPERLMKRITQLREQRPRLREGYDYNPAARGRRR